PGPWRSSRTPYWRAIYDAFVDPEVDSIVAACGAQMGKTEAIFNILGHRFTDGPYVPALYIGPTEKQVRSISRDRIDKMLRSTPVLWERTAKGHRYGVFEKFIAGVRLGFAWAGSATELASHPAGLVLVDERDRMESDVAGEGDPVSLARARLKNYLGGKLGVFSTPTIEGGSPTWALLDAGSLEFWAWPCPECGRYFVPELALLSVPEGATPQQARESARLACPHCGGLLESRQKTLCNSLGRYIRHRRLRDDEQAERTVLRHYVVDADPQPTRARSFWISGLASPWVTFGEVAQVLREAEQSGSIERLQAEVNTWGGECFALRGDAPDWHEVAANRRDYPPRTIPSLQVQIITAGVDVQKDGLYYVMRGWGAGMASWLLEHGFLAGDTAFDPVWNSLRNLLQAPIGEKRIDRALIDSGYRPGDIHRRPDHAVYTFCRSLPGLAFPAKGQDTLDQPYRYRNIDYSVGGAVIRGGVRLFHINTDYFKRWLHARIRWPEDQEGGFYLHAEAGDDYCRHLVAEELVIKPGGKVQWVRRSRENHYLDCEVLAAAAAYSLNVQQLAPVEEPGETSEPQPEPASGPERPPPSRYQRRRW
ncbi:MAG: hypothetical protein D6744_02820, partial [Planctomycetota bacterium]